MRDLLVSPVLPLLCGVLVAAVLGSGCSDATSSPSGPAADLSEELTGGNGPFIGAASPPDLTGYVQRELVAAGTASSYAAVGELGADGRWTFAEAGSAPYRTRVLVRHPADPADFSGTAIVEWLNVSGGVDADPDWSSLHEEITRRGHAWIGVSAQLIGVEGGPVLVVAPGAEGVAGRGLKSLDPARYGSLSHPGDGFSFDVYTQVARALRRDPSVLGGARAERVIAAGESQSAIALVTYYNGVHPLARAFDGFFVHSRASVGLPLVGPGEYADLASAFGSVSPILRTDVAEPALELQAEGDVVGVLNSLVARQDDSETFRLWEVAGTAHADQHLLGALAASAGCGAEINDGPLHLVAKAGLNALESWVRTGEAPPTAPRLDVAAGNPPTVVRDADGIATGGIRTPPVDVPVDVLSGSPGPNPSLFCLLLGSTIPLPEARIAELYASRADYVRRYAEASDATIAAGFVLTADLAALTAYSDPSRVAE